MRPLRISPAIPQVVVDAILEKIALIEGEITGIDTEIMPLAESLKALNARKEKKEIAIRELVQHLEGGGTEPLQEPVDENEDPIEPSQDTTDYLAIVSKVYNKDLSYATNVENFCKELDAWVSIGRLTDFFMALEGTPKKERKQRLRSLSSILLRKKNNEKAKERVTARLVGNTNIWGCQQWLTEPIGIQNARKTIK